MGINKAIISGNLTRDAELRVTAGGMAILSLGVAVDDRRKNAQTGEWEERVNYLDCTLFGARAKALHEHLKKGTKVAIEGKLRWGQWERDGEKRSKVEIVVDELELLSARAEEGQGGQAAAQPPAPAPAAPYPSPTAAAGYYAQQPCQPAAPYGAAPLTQNDIPF